MMLRKAAGSANVLASVAAEALAMDGSRWKSKNSSSNSKMNHISKASNEGNGSSETSSQETVAEDAVGGGSSTSDVDASEDEDKEDATSDAAALVPVDQPLSDSIDQPGHYKDSIVHCVRHLSPEQKIKAKTNKSGRVSRQGQNHTDLTCSDDEDDYNAVDMISDSDEDDPNLEETEERAIIESEEADCVNNKISSSPKILGDETDDGWGGFEMDNGQFMADVPYFDEQIGRTDSSVLASEADVLHTTSIFEGFSPPPLQIDSPRRVRFLTPRSDDSDVESDDEDINALFGPTHGEISSTGISQSIEDHNTNDNDNDSCGSSSGYETDYGDTTDEEDAPAAPASATTRPDALMRDPLLSSPNTSGPATPAATRNLFKIPTTPASSRVGPRIHTFTTSSRKPIATIDGTGDYMVIYGFKRLGGNKQATGRSAASTGTSTPTSVSRYAAPTLAAAPDTSDNDYSDFVSQASADPVLGSGTEMAMAGLYQDGLPSPQTVNPAPSPSSVFFPVGSMEAVNAALEDQDDDDDDEALLNVEDFIDFGEDSSDGEGKKTLEDVLMPKSSHHTASNSSTSVNSPHDFVKRFDPNVISAFRRGQSHSHAASRRTNHGLSLNTVAIKGGRHAAANASLSPQRKRKMSDAFGPRSSLGLTAKRRIINHR